MIEVEPSETVRDVSMPSWPNEANATSAGLRISYLQVREVKTKIAQEKGEYDAERMKVIYSGMCLMRQR